MEPRKITVVSTATQRKDVIMSAATTLEELKLDLTLNNINHEGMAFFEGLTKTELVSDESPLPRDVNYKGIVTNHLVFMLTNARKNIKSGNMTRGEVYAKIKEMNLSNEIRSMTGKSYTNIPTHELISILEVCISDDDDVNVNVTDTDSSLIKLISILYRNGILSDSDLESLNVSTDNTLKSPYSSSDISEMMEACGL